MDPSGSDGAGGGGGEGPQQGHGHTATTPRGRGRGAPVRSVRGLLRGRGTRATAIGRGGSQRGAPGTAPTRGTMNRTLVNSGPSAAPSSSTSTPASSSSPPAKAAKPPTFANRSAVFNQPSVSSAPTATAPMSDDGIAADIPTAPPSAAPTLAPPPPVFATFSSSPSPAHVPSSSAASDVEDYQPPQVSSSPAPRLQPPSRPFTPLNTSSDESDEEARKRRFDRKAAMSKNSNKWLQMKNERPALRDRYIAQGVLPDPDKPRQLSQATQFVGTCMDMCPEFEREEREFQGEGDELEVFVGTTKLDPDLAVKIYRRPAAGRELPLPDDVRPPAILKKTLDYLFHSLLPSSPDSLQLANVQGFIWNRTRAVRQDFIVQGQGDALTIECHERIARWHIFSLHWKGGSIDSHGQPRPEADMPKDRDPWSEQQELEQLAKTLTSLNEFYDDYRLATGKANPSPNEAEFRAYHLILNLYDPEVLRSVELLPEDVFDAEILQLAITLRGYAQRANRGGSARANALNTDAPMNFFSRFFDLLKSPAVPYLLSCMCENKFSDVRQGAFKSLCSNYNKAHRGPTTRFVKEALGADSEVQVIEWAESYGIEVQMEDDHTKASLKLHKFVDLQQAFNKVKNPSRFSFSNTIVEAKRGHWTSQQIVDGAASGAAPLLKVDAGPAITAKPAMLAPKPVQAPRPSSSASFPTVPSTLQPPTSSPAAQEKPAAPMPFATSATKMSPFASTFTPGAASVPSESAKTTSGFGIVKSEGTAFGGVASKPQQAPPSFGGFGSGSSFNKSTVFGAPPKQQQQQSNSTDSQSATPPAPGFSSFGKTATGVGFPQQQKPFSGFATKSPVTSFDTAAKPVPSTSAFGSMESSSSMHAFPQTSEPVQAKPQVTEGPPPFSQPTQAPSRDAPAESALAPAPAPPGTRKPSFTIENDAAARQVYHALVREYALKIAKEAVRRERERRRREARAYFIETMTQRLFAALRDETLETLLPSSTAWPALADEQRKRTVLLRSMDKWQLTHARRVEARRQRDRLEEVRREIQRRGLLDRHSSRAGLATSSLQGKRSFNSSHSHSSRRSLRTSNQSEDDMDVDDELSASIQQGSIQRASLWTEGSFAVAIASHIAHLVTSFRPSGMDSWRACVSLPPCGDGSGSDATETASSWLKRKFDLVDDDEDELPPIKTITVAPRMTVHVELAPEDAEEEEEYAIQAHSDAALVIFSLSPGVTAKTSDEATWEAERARLADLARRESITGSRYDTRLMVLTWSSAEDVLHRLGVHPGQKPWKDVSIVHLDGKGNSDPDSTFARGIASLVKDMSLNAAQHSILLNDVIGPLRRPWSDAVENAQTVLHRMIRWMTVASSPIDDGVKWRACKTVVEAFVTLVALAKYSFEVVIDHSETLLEDEASDSDSDEGPILPRLSMNEVLSEQATQQDPNEVIYRASELLLFKLATLLNRHDSSDPTTTAPDSSSLILAQALLLQAHAEHRSFPLSAFLEHVYTSILSTHLEPNWLSADPRHINGVVEAESGKIQKWCTELMEVFARNARAVMDDVRRLKGSSSSSSISGGDSGGTATATSAGLKRKDVAWSSGPPASHEQYQRQRTKSTKIVP